MDSIVRIICCVIEYRKKQVAKFLINNGADVTLSAKNGITAFDMASFIGKCMSVKCMTL